MPSTASDLCHDPALDTPASDGAHAGHRPATGADILGTLGAALWRGDQIGRSLAPTRASGFSPLDAELPGGGWPTAALIELLLPAPGQVEMRLVAPACAPSGAGLHGGSVAHHRPVVWIAPPHRPYTPALSALGLSPDQLLWIDPADATDAAWAAEQAVKSHSCHVVLWWAPQARPENLRRLHLAAQGSTGLLFVLRPAAVASQSSPAPLRLRLQADVKEIGSLNIHILKRRGPARDAPLHLDTRHLLTPALAHRLQRPLPRWPEVPQRPLVPISTPAGVRRPIDHADRAGFTFVG